MTPAALTNKLLVDVPAPSGVPRRRMRVEPAILGVLAFIATEIMFFSGLLSAYNIARAKVPMSVWPPPDQPRLPIESTAANSAVLVASGVLLWLAVRAWKQQKSPLLLALAASALGAVFVAVQGYEWSQLLTQGMTMNRSTFASFFYLIVGTHGLHVVGGLIGVAVVVRGVYRGTATQAQLQAAAIFWTFVVAVWPIVYVMVYL